MRSLLFPLPIAMNDWGYAQSVKSVAGITALAFPPYACCGILDIPWSPGLLNTCEMIVNDRLAAISDDPAEAVTYQWFPHCVAREQTVDGVRFKTTLFLPPDQRGVLEKIEIQNTSANHTTCTIGFDMRAAVTRKDNAWFANLPGKATISSPGADPMGASLGRPGIREPHVRRGSTRPPIPLKPGTSFSTGSH